MTGREPVGFLWRRPESDRMDEPDSTAPRFCLLGPPQIHYDRDPAWRFVPKRKGLELLAYLVLHASAPLGRDAIAFTFWPDANEEDARANLRRNLHVLVPLLPTDAKWIVAQPDTLRWNPEVPFWCDVVAFRAACARGDFAEAVRFYRGELLAGYYDEWLLDERERLVRAHHEALTQLVREHRTRRDFSAAAGYALELLGADPWREDIVRHLIAIRYESGDRAAALRQYDAFAERLRAEMHVGPMPETQALRDAILHSRSTGDVRGATATIASVAPSQVEPAWTLPFVGRDRELEALRVWWNRAATGAGAVVFVGGEAGIGKSSVVRAFAAQVGDEGGRVLYGGTSSPERFAYQAVLDAFAGAPSLIASSGIDPMRLNELAVLLPELKAFSAAATRATASAPQTSRAASDPERERERLFEAMAQVVEALAKTRPLALIIEDVHWAGQATLDLLGYFATRLAHAHVLVIVTHRDEDVLHRHRLQALRSQLAAQNRAATVALSPLSPASVGEILARLPQLRSDLAASHWHARTEGNPLFLSEMLRDAIERGTTSLPAGLAQVVEARLDRLSADARLAADFAAVMGDIVDFEVLGVAAGWSDDRTMDSLAELLDRRIIRETFDRARLRYAFTHNLVRQATYAAVAEGRRSAHHQVVARALERAFPDHLDDHAFEIARHYEACTRHEAASPWYLRAARTALVGFANAEAADHATRALEHANPDDATQLLLVRATARGRLGEQVGEEADLLTLKKSAAERGDGELTFEVLERLVAAYTDAGRFDRAAAQLGELRVIVKEQGGVKPALADELEARIAYEQDRYGAADELLVQACARYREAADPREIRALSFRAVTLRRGGRFAEAGAVLQRAAKSLDGVDDAGLHMRFLHAKLLLASAQQEFGDSEETAREMLRLAVLIGDRRAEADAHQFLAIALGKLHRFDAAEEHFAAAIAVNKLIGQRTANAGVLRNHAALQMDRFRFARALELTEAAEPLSEDVFHQAACAHNRMACLRELGDFAAAVAAGERAVELADVAGHAGLRGGSLAGIGFCLLALGDVRQARAKAEEGVHVLRQAEFRAHLGGALADLIEVYLASGAIGEAGAAAIEILELHKGGAKFFELPRALWAAARVLRENGDSDGANAAAREARAEADAIITSLGHDSSEAEWFRRQAWCQALYRTR